MAFCRNCGAALLDENVAFCTSCGTPTENRAAVPAAKEGFIDVTARMLRWETKAWYIGSIAFTLIGLLVFAIFSHIALFGLISGDFYAGEFLLYFFVYGLVIGGVIAAIGITNYVVHKRMKEHGDWMGTSFSEMRQRCESIGMLVFCVFINQAALVFFLINFVRMKANQAEVEALLRK